jgi:hypothetical protein
LRGTWFDRSKEFLARQRGEHTLPMQFATTFDVKLTPLPCLLDMTEDQRQAHYRRVVGEIQAKAEADNKEKGRTPRSVEAILAQDPGHGLAAILENAGTIPAHHPRWHHPRALLGGPGPSFTVGQVGIGFGLCSDA